MPVGMFTSDFGLQEYAFTDRNGNEFRSIEVASAMHDRRQFGRRTTALHAWIKIPGRPQMACIVRNLSVTGALLELEVPDWMPYRFRLVVEAAQFDVSCEIRHKGANSLGVMFIAHKERDAADVKPLLTDRDVWGGPVARPQ
ncbi:MAG: PilZ domain-containing protein [Hyphomicrobiaceae bacterium]